MGGGRRQEERRGCADTAEEPRPDLGAHRRARPVSTAAQQQVESASEMGRWGFSLLQNFFQRKLCLRAGISLLYQDKVAPGGCRLAKPLQCPKQVTTSPKGRCPFGTNPGNVSVDQFFPSDECLWMFIPVCYQSYSWFGHLPSGIIRNCSLNNWNRRWGLDLWIIY